LTLKREGVLVATVAQEGSCAPSGMLDHAETRGPHWLQPFANDAELIARSLVRTRRGGHEDAIDLNAGYECNAQTWVDREGHVLPGREMFRSADAHVEHRVSVS
jgi:hypothetical protein